MLKKAELVEQLANHLVVCRACSWYCKIASGQVGICATRYNRKGELISLVYGKAIGLNLDPVEKKPLYHFFPGERLLSFGTVGCNFGCLFCQNWEMSQINKTMSKRFKGEQRLRQLTKLVDQMSETVTPKEIVDLAKRKGAIGIAYTYNEPAIFAEFAYATMVIAKKNRLKNVFVSNGYESVECFNYIKNYLDGINIDLKSSRADFYHQICKGRIEPVKENISRYFKSGIETEVTTLVIPGLNDSEKELKDIAEFLIKISPEIPWHLSAFYPAYQMTDLPPTSAAKLVSGYMIGKQVGLSHVYIGNIIDWKHASTYCPACNQLLIKRDGYLIEFINFKKGRCGQCGNLIYGQWER